MPGLTLDQVTVLNTDGTVLASGGDAQSAAPGKMVSLEKTVGKELQDNIAKTLAPYLGIDNFEISVAARLNTDKRQTNETAYNPESRVERSVRVVKETGSQQNSANRTAVGVEQNVPAEQQGTAGGDQSKRTNERREELTNYEVEHQDDLHRQRRLPDREPDHRRAWSTASGSPPRSARRPARKRSTSSSRRWSGWSPRRPASMPSAATACHVAALEFIDSGPSLEAVPSIGVVEHLLRNTGSIVNAVAMVAMTALLLSGSACGRRCGRSWSRGRRKRQGCRSCKGRRLTPRRPAPRSSPKASPT